MFSYAMKMLKYRKNSIYLYTNRDRGMHATDYNDKKSRNRSANFAAYTRTFLPDRESFSNINHTDDSVINEALLYLTRGRSFSSLITVQSRPSGLNSTL